MILVMKISKSVDHVRMTDMETIGLYNGTIITYILVNHQMQGSKKDTFSSYYGGNCAKEGVFLQLCDWGGAYIHCGQVEFQTHRISINLVFLNFKRNLQRMIW